MCIGWYRFVGNYIFADLATKQMEIMGTNSRRSGEWSGEGCPFTRYRLVVAGCEGEGEFDCF